MPRIRTIKPEFPQSESMGRVSRDARLLFILLWTQADDAGRLRGNSRMLASILFPYDSDAQEHIDSWLEDLEREGCITRYLVNGDSYVQVVKSRLHQRSISLRCPKSPRLPSPVSALAKRREASRILSKSPRWIKEGIKERIKEMN